MQLACRVPGIADRTPGTRFHRSFQVTGTGEVHEGKHRLPDPGGIPWIRHPLSASSFRAGTKAASSEKCWRISFPRIIRLCTWKYSSPTAGVKDDTRQQVEGFARRYPFIHLLDNPARVVPHALNACIRRSRGEVILRMDAHAIYPNDYVSRLVRARPKTGFKMSAVYG